LEFDSFFVLRASASLREELVMSPKLRGAGGGLLGTSMEAKARPVSPSLSSAASSPVQAVAVILGFLK